MLPFNWAGVALIVFAFVLFGLELFITSHGILGIGGAVALVLGGLLLTSGNPPEFQVSRWLVIGMAAAMATMVLFVLVNILRIRSDARADGHGDRRSAAALSPARPSTQRGSCSWTARTGRRRRRMARCSPANGW